MNGSIIAFSGKGGSGKTTLASLVIRQLLRLEVRPVLAVDADPNATLGLTLGMEIEDTIADLRDRMGLAAQKPSEIPKDRLMGQGLAQLLAEGPGFDVLTMGRPEGPKCYCYVNGLLRRYLKELRGSYAAVVVDCEAGMEYLSRLTVDDVDALVLVAEATAVGLTSARRISALADSLPIRVARRVLALNKIGPLGLSGPVQKAAAALAVDGTVHVPFDDDLYRRCVQGAAVDDDAGGVAREAAGEIARLCLGRPQLQPEQANSKESIR
ncbi:MAG: carbon monoxide dehydrogenase [Phycisphaerae bacterium]